MMANGTERPLWGVPSVVAIDVRYFFPRTAFERSPVIAAAFAELLREGTDGRSLQESPETLSEGWCVLFCER